jgi:hypothetical protein
MRNNSRLIAGAVCAAAGLALVILPQEVLPWLPGSKAAGGVLILSGAMFLFRGYAERKSAPITGSDFKVEPGTARNRRKRRNKAS